MKLAYLLAILTLVGCNSGEEYFKAPENIAAEAPEKVSVESPVDVVDPKRDIATTNDEPAPQTLPPTTDLVCDPFGSDSSTSAQNGIYGKLYDGSSLATNPTQLSHIIKPELVMSSDVYFTKIDVTPRSFTSGFPGPDGTPIKNSAGDDLHEWVGIRYEGRIALGDGDEPGFYEFVTHSDDGSILRLKINGEWREIVSNDGHHPPRIVCSSEYIYLDKNSKIEFELDYFQGPRTYISMVLYWRKVASKPEELSQVVKSSMCGQYSYEADVLQLVTMNYKKPAPQNYLLPAEISSNPCAD